MGKVLVTGGNGYVAAHVIHEFLKKGHVVVATVRSESKAQDILTTVPASLSAQKSNLSTVIVKDITKDEEFEKILKEGNFDAIIHTAAPFHFNVKDPLELVDPAVKGTTAVMHAAKKYGPTVKRIVITSSFASVVKDPKSHWPGHVYTEADWNPIPWEKTIAGDLVDAYYGAKTFAEKAAWDFIEKEKPSFDLTVLNPPYVYGPVAHKVDSLSSLNTSSAMIYNYFSGQLKELPVQDVLFEVDVRDLAIAHVAAFEKPEAGNQRFLIIQGHWSPLQLTKILRERYPEQSELIPTKAPEGVDPETGLPTGGYYTVDNSKSVKTLGIQYRPFKDSVIDFIESVKNLPK